jgi:hypothetical protein
MAYSFDVFILLCNLNTRSGVRSTECKTDMRTSLTTVREDSWTEAGMV